MSLHATPLLYLNLGGEMLYVLRQRLKAQRIDVDKTVQVLDDVTAALLNPKILSWVFKEAPHTSIASLRPTLEAVALCSIMRLDTGSMDKLFDLMIMMVKYQLSAATGPREVILLTLNHTDAMRDMVSDSHGQECAGLVHQMVVDFYSNLTFEQIWKARHTCLEELEPYSVRVSILLRLGLQNEDATFNLTPQKYDERYEEHFDEFSKLKLNDVGADKYCNGSFCLFGDRSTLLGRNMYSPTYGVTSKLKSKNSNQHFLKDCGTKAELGMLAAQLGTEEAYERPFTLNLFSNEDDDNTNDKDSSTETDSSKSKENDDKAEKTKLNEEYKNKLENVYGDFFDEEHEKLNHSINLLDLLDKIE